MQGTLLTVGIAIILALVAALVGPQFVDWTAYRTVIESRASRIVGVPVRVEGAIEVQLLPTPRLALGRVVAGGGPDGEPRLAAARLAAEFALGALVRGEVRAHELRLIDPELRLGLDPNGAVAWPQGRRPADAAGLSIERLSVENGRAVLTDRRSGTELGLERWWFAGDVRSLGGPIRGEGGFVVAGERYGYRVSAGRNGDDGATRLRLALDPSDRPLTIELDTAVRSEQGVPRLEGNLTVARPAGIANGAGRGSVAEPWRATARIKASPASVLFEQVEVQYGPEERAIKLGGTAELELGRTPRLDGVLSTQRIDLDRALALPDDMRRKPLAGLTALGRTVAGAPALPFPVRIGFGIEQAMLAGQALQGIRGDLRIDTAGWDLETLELRAPGFSNVKMSGRLDLTSRGVGFAGPMTVEASQPKALIAWLEGRSETPGGGASGALRIGGEVALGLDRVAIERLKVEFDRKPIEGRLAYAFAAENRPARLEAELTAADLDVDATAAFVRAATGTGMTLPGEVTVGLAIAKATIAGLPARQVTAKLRYGADGLMIERLSVADLGRTAFDARGRIEGPLTAPRGSLSVDVDAEATDGLVALVSTVAPAAADRLRRLDRRLVPFKARTELDLRPGPAGATQGRMTVTGDAGAVRLRLSAEAGGDAADWTGLDLRVDGQLAASDGGVLAALLDLDRAVAVDGRPGLLMLTARGPAGGDLRVDARLTAGGLAASANGSLRIAGADAPAGGLDLLLQAADVAMLRPAAGAPVPVTLRTRLAMADGRIGVDDVAGTVAGTAVRGRFTVVPGAPWRIDGEVEADTVDAAALVAAAVGMPGRGAAPKASAWSSEPFAPSLLAAASGRIGFKVSRAAFTPAVVLRQAQGDLDFDADGAAFENVEGAVGDGRLTGRLAVRRGPAGVAARARVALTNVDATVLLPAEGRSGLAGRLSVQADADGTGLSPATLMGSLAGSGTIMVQDGRFGALDPKVFEAVIRAVDQGLAVDAVRVAPVVTAGLDSGPLAVPQVDGSFTISAGQLRLSSTIARGERADLMIAGTVDLVDWLLDARLTLTGPDPGSGAGRPNVLVLLKGPPGAPRRHVDVSALSGWLTLRAVDRQAKRIEAIEATRNDPVVPPETTAVVPDAAPRRPSTVAPAVPAPAASPPPRTVRRPPAAQPETPTIRPQAPPLPPPIEISPVPRVAPGGPARGPSRTQSDIPRAPVSGSSSRVLNDARLGRDPRPPAEIPPAAETFRPAPLLGAQR